MGEIAELLARLVHPERFGPPTTAELVRTRGGARGGERAVTRPPLTRARLAAAVAGLALVALAAFAAALALGPAGLSPRALWRARPAPIRWRARCCSSSACRASLAAALLGAALALAGVAFQALLRNPLADPYVLGVSGGASLGGVVALLAGATGALVPAAAFVGALGALVGARADRDRRRAARRPHAAPDRRDLQRLRGRVRLLPAERRLARGAPRDRLLPDGAGADAGRARPLGLDALVVAAVALALFARGARRSTRSALGEEGALRSASTSSG